MLVCFALHQVSSYNAPLRQIMIPADPEVVDLCAEPKNKLNGHIAVLNLSFIGHAAPKID